MASVYFSYNRNDKDLVTQVADKLTESGHEVSHGSLTPGVDWRRALTERLKEAEVFVVFLSKNSRQSTFVLSEIGAARAYADQSGGMLLVPVVIDEIEIPPVVEDIQVIQAPNRNVDQISTSIDRAISHFVGLKAAKEQKAADVARRIEANAAEYIDEAIQSLRVLESRNRNFGNGWYIAGFVALLAGIGATYQGIASLSHIAERTWVDFAILTLKTVIVIGVLGACAKYAFTLGKSYASESLKSADRIHAISFGKFFLRVFGTQATWPELKEVFQHWNIDRTSAFTNLDASQFDPKLVDSIVEVARLVAGKQTDKT